MLNMRDSLLKKTLDNLMHNMLAVRLKLKIPIEGLDPSSDSERDVVLDLLSMQKNFNFIHENSLLVPLIPEEGAF